MNDLLRISGYEISMFMRMRIGTKKHILHRFRERLGTSLNKK